MLLFMYISIVNRKNSWPVLVSKLFFLLPTLKKCIDLLLLLLWYSVPVSGAWRSHRLMSPAGGGVGNIRRI